MASLVIHGEMPESFSIHLREAIETLGYFRLDALEQLLALYREQWPRGLSSNMFRLADIQHLMAEQGLAEPHHAQKATFLRAHFNLSRKEFDSKQPDSATGLIFWARGQWLCDEARPLDQSKVAMSEKWPLPLPSCRQEWCPCTWTCSFDLD